jgi:hypothetical protein
LAFFGVIERGFFCRTANSIRDGVHVDDVLAIFGSSKRFAQLLAVLLDVFFLGAGQKIKSMGSKSAVWTGSWPRFAPPVLFAHRAFMAEATLTVGSYMHREKAWRWGFIKGKFRYLITFVGCADLQENNAIRAAVLIRGLTAAAAVQGRNRKGYLAAAMRDFCELREDWHYLGFGDEWHHERLRGQQRRAEEIWLSER